MSYNQDAIDWAWGVELTAVRGQPAISTRRLVLTCLARYCDSWWLCYPAQATIAKDTGLTTRSVRETLKSLSDSKHIEMQSRHLESSYIHLLGEPGSYRSITTLLEEQRSSKAKVREGGFKRGWDAHKKHISKRYGIGEN